MSAATIRTTDVLRVLVVEDEPDEIVLLRELCRSTDGAEAEFVAVGRLDQAIKKVFEEHFDVILLDLYLPDSEGRETLEKMSEAATDVPIVVRTGHADREMALSLTAQGAQDCLLKETDQTAATIRVLQRAVARYRTERALRDKERRLRAHAENMEKDLEIARTIHRALLPQKAPQSERLRVEFEWHQRESIGGDCFAFRSLQNGGLALFLGDLEGHGVRAALHLSLVKFLVDRAFAECRTRPTDYLTHLNSELLDHMPHSYVTALYALFKPAEPAGCNMLFGCAGHPCPVLLRPGTPHAHALQATGFPIGMVEEYDVDEVRVPLRPGDRVFLFTDGLTDVTGSAGRPTGMEGLCRVLENRQTESLKETIKNVFSALKALRGDPAPQDDMVLIGVEVNR